MHIHIAGNSILWEYTL